MRAGVRSFLKPWRIGDGWKSKKYQLILESFIHDLCDEIEASSVIVVWHAKPGLFDEIERYKTAHNDVAAVCEPSSLSDEVCRGTVEHGQWHSPISSSGNPVFCSGVSRVPWSKDAVVAVKSPGFMP